MDATTIQIGDEITARYYDETVSGTVVGRSWHTIRRDLLQITIEFPPTVILGYERTRIMLSVNSEGEPVEGWNTSRILTSRTPDQSQPQPKATTMTTTSTTNDPTVTTESIKLENWLTGTRFELQYADEAGPSVCFFIDAMNGNEHVSSMVANRQRSGGITQAVHAKGTEIDICQFRPDALCITIRNGIHRSELFLSGTLDDLAAAITEARNA